MSTTAVLHILPLPQYADASPDVVFGQFAQRDYSLFFDSAAHPQGAFDILLFDPIAVLSAQNTDITYTKLVEQAPDFVANTPLFSCLETLQQTVFDVANIDTSGVPDTLYQRLPFIVGIAGSFGYELNQHVEALPAPKTPYHTPDMYAGLYTQSIIYDRQTQCYYHCYLSGYPVSDLATVASAQDRQFELCSDWQPDHDQGSYREALAKIHEYILAGDCYQVNFTQRFANRYHGDEYSAYCTLRMANQAPFSCFMRTPYGAILSISPERFLKINNGHVSTKPIKGTMPRDPDPQRDHDNAQQLLQSSKDQAENLMIVDLLRNDMAKHCKPHSVVVPALFKLESYPAVHHLVSTIEGELASDTHPWQLFAGAFPGGSITGAPKVRAMQIIHELELSSRHIYCGSIGYLGLKHDMDTNIAIRTLLCEQGKIYCWAGGGIVLDSNADDEYAELYAKISKILPVL
jgi:para-aminobenzoate synthetase component 1